MGKVRLWYTDKSNSLIEKIRMAKKYIEENIFLVKVPSYEFTNINNEIYVQNTSDSSVKVKYRNSVSIKIIPNEDHNKIFITSNGSDPKLENSQREETIECYEYTTDEDITLKFCAIDHEGRYSKVLTADFINEDKKYEVKYVNQTHQMGIEDIGISVKEEPKVQVTLPRDIDSLKQCIQSIIIETKEKYGLSKEQFIEVLNMLIEDLRW